MAFAAAGAIGGEAAAVGGAEAAGGASAMDLFGALPSGGAKSKSQFSGTNITPALGLSSHPYDPAETSRS